MTPASRPRPAVGPFPYLSHRTVAEVDADARRAVLRKVVRAA